MKRDKQGKSREYGLEARSNPERPAVPAFWTEICCLGSPWLILTLSPAELTAVLGSPQVTPDSLGPGSPAVWGQAGR